MRRSRLVQALLVFSVAALQPAAAQPQPPTAAAARPPAVVVPPDQVIARIGSQPVRQGDFIRWLHATAGAARAEQLLNDPQAVPRIRGRFLEMKVLAAKARKDGVAKLPVFKARMEAEEEQVLAQLLTSEEDGTAGRLLKQRIENPSDEELRAWFDRNPGRWDTPEKYTARQLIVTVKGGPRTADRGVTEEEAKATLARVKTELAAGRSFEELVREYSDEPSAKANGGLLKDFPMTGAAKEFEDAVRRQEIGTVGEPVRSAYGYHLIQVEARSPRQPAVFEQVKEQVRQHMLPERRQRLITEFIEDAKKDVGFVVEGGASH